MANIVAIVGRPNVGKSTFFNRLVEQRKAITNDESGITRDRHYGQAQWCGKFFTVIDTGGYVVGSEDIFEGSIRNQVELAIDEADVILFVVDCHDGITPLDEEFAQVLRRLGSNKEILVVANKADNKEHMQSYAEFYALGFDMVFPITATHGSGTGDLLDDVVRNFPAEGVENPYEGIPRISILGRPNAGKSSFLNTLIGKERSIVTDIAGTTRDSINYLYTKFERKFVLTDTAGIRKKARVKEDVEFYSVMRAIRSLEDSDVCILMVDATRNLEGQDLSIINLAIKRNKGLVIIINKWDLIEKDNNTARRFEKEIQEKLALNSFIPIIFVSVLKKKRVLKAIDMAIDVYNMRKKRISTSELNDVMLKEIERNPPPAIKGKYIRIKYITQLHAESPAFAFFCNLPQYIKDPYVRFLKNKIRSHFGFEGVPVRIFFRKK